MMPTCRRPAGTCDRRMTAGAARTNGSHARPSAAAAQQHTLAPPPPAAAHLYVAARGAVFSRGAAHAQQLRAEAAGDARRKHDLQHLLAWLRACARWCEQHRSSSSAVPATYRALGCMRAPRARPARRRRSSRIGGGTGAAGTAAANTAGALAAPIALLLPLFPVIRHLLLLVQLQRRDLRGLGLALRGGCRERACAHECCWPGARQRARKPAGGCHLHRVVAADAPPLLHCPTGSRASRHPRPAAVEWCFSDAAAGTSGTHHSCTECLHAPTRVVASRTVQPTMARQNCGTLLRAMDHNQHAASPAAVPAPA